MEKRGFSTASYMLQNSERITFGYVRGEVSLPDYNVSINVHFLREKEMKNEELSIDGYYTMTFDLFELEIIQKGIEAIQNQIKTLINLSKRDQLKDEFYSQD
jgi:hypothetical protein